MSKFVSKWTGPKTPSIKKKLSRRFRKEAPNKSKLNSAIKSIQIQMASVARVSFKLKDRDNFLLKSTIRSLKSRNENKANILANELSQIRNLIRQVTSARLALEQISMRMKTITDLGDAVATLAPAVAAIRGVQDTVTTVMPQTDNSFSEISNLLSSILVDAGQSGGLQLDFKAATLDAEKILDDASTIAEKEIKSKLPEIPAELSIPNTEKLNA